MTNPIPSPSSAQPASRGVWQSLQKAHTPLLVLVAIFMLVKSAMEFFPQWDALTYHLPSALSLYGLTTYTPEPWVQHMLAGIPILPHRVQGLLVFITGRLSFANVINPLALAITVFSIWWVTRNRQVVKWFYTACLAVPLVVIHHFTSYIDLWNGAFLATGFVWLARFFEAVRRPRPSDRPVLWAALCLGSIAVSFNSKYQAWPFAACLIVWLMIGIALLFRKDPRAFRRCILLLLLSAPLFLAHPVRNYLAFENPTSPVANPVFVPSDSSQMIDPSVVKGRHPQIPKLLWEASEPTRFFYSVFEITRFIDTRFPMRWSLDQFASDYGNNSPNHRMGGWFYGTVLVLLMTIGMGAFRRQLPLLPLAIFGSLIALSAFMPQSHELRYWLCLPLIAAYLAALTLSSPSSNAHFALKLLLSICALFVFATVMWPFGIELAPPSAYAPQEAREFWQAMEQHPEARNLKLRVPRTPQTIFWAGPEFNSYHVQELFPRD